MTDPKETQLMQKLRELANMGTAAIVDRTTISAADVERLLSPDGIRMIACVEGVLLEFGLRIDLLDTSAMLRIPFQTPDDYRAGVTRYALLCEIDPHPASQDGLEAVALLFWINRYEGERPPATGRRDH
jgi:hypothetical protein